MREKREGGGRREREKERQADSEKEKAVLFDVICIIHAVAELTRVKKNTNVLFSRP